MLLKIRKIGNSFGVIIPKEQVDKFSIDGWIEVTFGACVLVDVPKPDNENRPLSVEETVGPVTSKVAGKVINRPFLSSDRCSKHKGSYKYSCGCK